MAFSSFRFWCWFTGISSGRPFISFRTQVGDEWRFEAIPTGLFADASFDSTTCTGYGFVTIVFAFITYGLIYKYFIGKHLKQPFKSYVWSPLVDFLSGIRHGAAVFYAAFLVLSVAFLVWDSRDNWRRLMPITGLVVFMAGGYVCSHDRKLVRGRLGVSVVFQTTCVG